MSSWLARPAAAVVLEDDTLDGQFDLAMGGVGGTSLERSARALAKDGMVALYGSTSAQPARIGLGDFRAGPFGRIQSFFIYQSGVQTFGRDLGLLVGLVAGGRLQPQVGLDVSWRELGTAVERLRGRQVDGKVVLRID